MPDRQASDGLPARENGRWALDKLSFLDYYGSVALTVTRRFRERHYVDLFAGPGRNVERGGVEEWEGSPIRVLKLRDEAHDRVSFTHATFVNLNEGDFNTLRQRIDALYDRGEAVIPRENVSLLRGDANILLRRILARIQARSFVLAVADIEAPSQWPWTTVQELAASPAAVDLYGLLPINMGLLRLAGYDDPELYADHLTRFYGNDEWWRIVQEFRRTDGQAPEFRRQMVDLYVRGLRSLRWRHAQCVLPAIRGAGQILYEMYLATSDDRGKEIANYGGRHARSVRSDQLEMRLD